MLVYRIDTVIAEGISGRFDPLSDMTLEELARISISWGMEFLVKILTAVVIYIIGNFLIKRLCRFIGRVMERNDVDLSLRGFLISLTRILMIIGLVIVIISLIGINITSFIALFASAGLGIGMAMSGMLQNFAAGVMILFQKQYSVGDFVELQSYSGIVKEIRMFSTTINTFDNKKIIIPNSVIATNVITNFTSEKTRRVEWRINIYYGADFDKAKNALIELIGKDKRLLEDKEMLVLLHSFGESSACIVARAWINSDDYWDVYFDYNEAIYKRFNEIGIEFHVPQMGVHISHQNQKT